MKPSNIVGPGEIAAMYQVTPETVSRWIRDDPGFPEPLVLAMGKVFHRPSVVAWGNRTGRNVIPDD